MSEAELNLAALKEGLSLAELENSNLRKALMWAASHITGNQRLELANMICQPLVDGGVLEDVAEEEAMQARKVARDIERLTDLAESALEAESLWNGRHADEVLALISRLREGLPKQHPPSLAFLRELVKKNESSKASRRR